MSTISRLHRAPGCRNSAELKIGLDQARHGPAGRRHPPGGRLQHPEAEIAALGFLSTEALHSGWGQLCLSAVAGAIARAKRACLIGCGVSSGAAAMGSALFMLLRVPAFAVGDVLLQMGSNVFLETDDELIALTSPNTGCMKSIGDALYLARRT